MKKTIGNLFHDMVVSAKNLLTRKKEETNNMNVFPVPDGDTGINMSLTMSTVAGVDENLTLGQAAEETANQMLRSARGNSGAILSLFFRGVGKAFHELKEANALAWVKAFEAGTKEAYRAVMSPSEGTILTVMRIASEDARAAYTANRKISVNQLFDVVVESAERTLEKTPEMLPVLKEAGVVDAGGYGFVCVLQGMKAVLDGHPIDALPEDEGGVPEASFADFSTSDITFGYCTECIVDKSEEFYGENTAKELCAFVTALGDSVVFVDDEKMIKLHVHTNDPGLVLTEALRYGSLFIVKIENMRNQHTALVGDSVKAPEVKKAQAPLRTEKKFGFVSVCMGEGIKGLFLDVGVDDVIEGGQTMNPSTQDLIDAVYRTPAEVVYILPNNKNIAMVAKAASELVSERRVVVLPTQSVPEGVAAMIAYNPDATEEENLAAMEAAIAGVTTMSVTYAVRDTKVGRFRIAKGQFLGLVENTIACVADSSADCMKQLARGMVDAGFVTILYGENVSEEEAEAAAAYIREKTEQGCEVTVMSGGQPIYDYVIWVEQA
ncbi:MAG: DAK2 domain-containing protein [Ruminococcaceae bacterium]|nr:DAK2 domain-containing protein [Oscillospiraceae bacterium]